ncbi:hypothetical protein HK102_007388, partial [Quaeritorhiza haematococci]
MDVDVAISEASRLITEEKISLFIGDINDILTSAEAPLLDNAYLPHCSSTANAIVLPEDLGWVYDPNGLTTQAATAQYGQVASEFLKLFPLRGRVVIITEDIPDCNMMMGGFDDYWVNPLAFLKAPAIDLKNESYREWDIWRTQIEQVRTLKAEAVLHCGTYRSYYALLEQAVTQGLYDDAPPVFVLMKKPEVDIGATDYARLAPYMFGTLLFNSSKRAFYSESREDPYFKLVKKAFDAVQNPFATDGPPTLSFETANLAACVAMLIPTLSQLVSTRQLRWNDIVKGQTLEKLKGKYTMLQVATASGLPGTLDGSRAWGSEGYEAIPVALYNANKKDVLSRGSFMESLTRVATLIRPGGTVWKFKNDTLRDVINRISFAEGSAPTKSKTIKIGFMWSAKPSCDEYVRQANDRVKPRYATLRNKSHKSHSPFNGVDVNQELLPLQALVDYWNNNNQYYPKTVKLELVYGSHSMDP